MTIQATTTGSPKGMGRLLLVATLATTFALGVGAGVALREATSDNGGTSPATTAVPAAHAAGSVEAAPTRGGMAVLYAEQQAARTRTSDGTDTMGGMAEHYRDQQREAAVSSSTRWFMRYGDGETWYLIESQRQAEDAGEVISYRNKSLLLQGKTLPVERLIVVTSSFDEQQVRLAAAEAERVSGGSPGVTVIDLRAGGEK
jgi:hypothetical protein